MLTKYKCEEPFPDHFCFVGSKPRLMDIGSISNRRGQNGFIKHAILRELRGTGIGPHIKDISFDDPEGWYKLLELADTLPLSDKHNQWDGYNKRPLPTPGSPADDEESVWLRKMIEAFDIRTVLDLGGNDGYFAFSIEKPGLRICSIDNATNAVIKGFLHAKQHRSKVTFYDIDLLKDYPPHIGRLTGNRWTWHDTLTADCVVASSVMHHLQHQGKDFKWQADLCSKVCRKLLLFEYIDKQDPHVKEWPQSWSREQFLDSMSEDWTVVDTLSGYASDAGSRPYRTWYAFERKIPKPFT